MDIINKKINKLGIKRFYSCKKNQGFSLVELMFALTMGILIIGLVVSLVFSNQRSKAVTEVYADIVNNANQAMSILTESINRTGYNANINSSESFSIYSGSCGTMRLCTNNGITSLGDQIAIQYIPINGFDCAGNVIATGEIATDIFYVAQDADNNNINSLFCRGYQANTGSYRGNPRSLVSGIDRLDILFGLSSDGLNINQYSTPNAMDANASTGLADAWHLIKTVRISILASSPENMRIFDENTRTYNLPRAGEVSYTDRIIRRLFSTTVSLKNVK